MKLKAIENILMKCAASTKQGQPTTEASQMMGLLRDIKFAPIAKSALSRGSVSPDSPTHSPGRWSFFDKNPHSLGGKKPYKGGKMYEAEPAYNYIHQTPKGRALRVLERLPKNLVDPDEQ